LILSGYLKIFLGFDLGPASLNYDLANNSLTAGIDEQKQPGVRANHVTLAQSDQVEIAAFKTPLPSAAPRRWALDEYHFQQHGTWCRMCVPPDSVVQDIMRHHRRLYI
jgi:hypothetical protein